MKIKTFLSGALIAALLAGCASSAVTVSDPEPNSNATEAATIEESAEAVSSTEASSSDSEMEYTDYAPLKDLCSDYFTLGVGINGSSLENQTINLPHYMEMCKYHFNSCTMTNLMKSCYILDQFASQDNLKNGNEEPALNFASIDPTLKWCQENGMKMRGHTLVWHTQAPNWFFREGYTDEGEYVDKETMLLRMESYIKQLVTHVQEEYPGVVYCWDVVNEAVEPDACDPDSYFKCRVKTGDDPNPWYETIGEDYVEMAFTYARKYVTDGAKLFYNDYNTYQESKTEGIYALCSRLKEKGLIDGIGMQGYWGIDYPKDVAIKKAIEKFAELDLEIQVTELSIGIENETNVLIEKQGERYGEVFKLLHDMDKEAGGPANITNVTLFGLVDHYREGDTTNTRIFDMNYDPKPAYFKIKEAMENY